MLQPGTPAPDVTATATDGSTVRLSEHRGSSNVVLFFYPKDDTGGCTREACAFRDARPQFDALDAVIYGVSMDDVPSHRAFTDKNDLNFPLLADTDGSICDAFGVPQNDGWPQRVTFLIDRDGVIRRVWEQVQVDRHADEVREAVEEL